MQRTIAYIIAAMILVAAIPLNAQQASSAAARAALQQLPLAFEENHGQADPAVKFIARKKGLTSFLTTGGMVLSLHPTTGVPESASPSKGQRSSVETVQFHLLGAARNPRALGENPLPGEVNYFFGNDPSRWRTHIRTYERIRYEDVYPGIDLVYYGNHGQIEYDFVLSPKADPGRIHFEIKGAEGLELTDSGALRVHVHGGELEFQTPRIYQDANGKHEQLQGGYEIQGASTVGFHVAKADPTKTLVIDPVLLYSSYLGGSGDDEPSAIAVDSTGSIYVTGYTDSTDFPLATLGSLPPGSDHVFLAKFDPTGSSLIYSDYIGGNSQDYAFSMTLGPSKDVYLAGGTASSDFPTVNAFQATYPGSFNAFLTRVSSDGSSLIYSTYLGGNGSDAPSAVKLDSASNIYVAGTTSSTNFPTSNAFQSTAAPNQGGLYGDYGFISKFSADGSSLLFSTYLAGSANTAFNCGSATCWPQPSTSLTGMALDSLGNVYVGGLTNTYDFPTTPGVYQTSNTTSLNALVGFVSKLSTGGTLQYSTYFYEPSGFTEIKALAVDNAGSAYITGLTFSNGTFPVTSTSICDPAVSGDACSYAFVTKFDATASTLAYSTFLGPNNYAIPSSIALDQNGGAYVLATTSSDSFATVNGIQSYAGGNDLLLVQIDSAATTELFATYLGGSSDENAAAMFLAPDGSVYIAADTTSTDVPTTQQAFQTTIGGNTDAVIMKLGTAVTPLVSTNPTSLSFSAQPVSSTSSAQIVTVQNVGTGTLSVASVSASGDFAQTNNCGSVAPSGSCTISVTFTPTASGQRSGTLQINDNAAGSPHTVALSGNGTDFALTASLGTATVKAGSPASFALTLTPAGTFSGQVQLACSGAPANSTCSVTPSAATPGANTVSINVGVTTKSSSAAIPGVHPLGKAPGTFMFMEWLTVAALGGLWLLSSRRKRLIALPVIGYSLLVLSGCVGGTTIVSNGGTPKGTYTLTVTGTSGSLHHSVPLTLTVQ